MSRKRNSLLPLLLTGTLLLSGCTMEMPQVSTTDEAQSEEAQPAAAPSAKDDFYGYINYDTIMNTTIEYGESAAGSFNDLSKKVAQQLTDIVNEIGTSATVYPDGSNEQLVQSLYKQVLAGADGEVVMAQMMSDIQEVRDVQNINSLIAKWIAMAEKYGVSFPVLPQPLRDHNNPEAYALYIPQITGFSGYSFENMMKNDSEASGLWGHAEDILIAIGDEKESASTTSKEYVYVAMELARFTDISLQYTNDPYADCGFYTEEQISAILPALDKKLSELCFGIANPYSGYYVQDIAQLEKLGELLTDEYLQQWKIGIIVDIVGACSSFINEENDMLTALFGKTPDENSQLEIWFSGMLQEELGEIYSEKYYTNEMDAAIKQMFEDIRSSYRTLISNAGWLSAEGRNALLKKLENIKLVSGCIPHEVKASDAAVIGGDLFETYINLNRRSFNKLTELIGKPYDKNSLDMTPQTVNACYNTDNKVTITVAIMNDPFFCLDNSYYENLGALGAIVGHEVGHAFDSDCISYDEIGRYNPEWLPESDRKVLSERADMVKDYFSNYAIMEVYCVDGELTKGENYADLGAVECITQLTDNKDDLKTLFSSYAKIWCSISTDTDAITMLTLDVHSPDRIRTNAVLSSCDKFYEAYDIKEGDGMYKAPEERVSRW